MSHELRKPPSHQVTITFLAAVIQLLATAVLSHVIFVFVFVARLNPVRSSLSVFELSSDDVCLFVCVYKMLLKLLTVQQLIVITINANFKIFYFV